MKRQAAAQIEFIAQIYERSFDCVPTDFCTWSLALLAARIPVDGASWLMLRSDAHTLSCAQAHHLAGRLPPAELLPDLAAVVEAATAGSLVIDPRCSKAPGLPAALHDNGSRAVLMHASAHPNTLFSSLLLLYRRIDSAAFSEEERVLLELVAPHMVRAWLLAHKRAFKLDSTLQRMGRRNRGPACLCDASGAIFAASPEFIAAVRCQFPQWDELRIPFPLPAAEVSASRHLALNVGRLHLRVGTQGGLRIVHARPRHPFDELTQRERDVVQAIVGGRSFKNLARRLGVSASTVANHASNIYQKLGVYSRDDVVELSLREGTTQPSVVTRK